MTYQQMLDHLAELDEGPRRAVIAEHWQTVLCDGFVAFVQGQMESARSLTAQDGVFDKVFEGQSEDIKRVMREQLFKALDRTVRVWNSMGEVYGRLQKHSEQHSSSGGMVDHGRHERMPRGVKVTPAAHCYRCGSPAVTGGLCSGCQATEDAWKADDLEYDRQLYRQHQDDLDYQRVQDDAIYYASQPDFNSYDDY